MVAGVMLTRSTHVILNDVQDPPAEPVRDRHVQIRKATARRRRGSLVPRDDIVSGLSFASNPG
jgi:hypothetical protein